MYLINVISIMYIIIRILCDVQYCVKHSAKNIQLPTQGDR